jgi:hypothetical protein
LPCKIEKQTLTTVLALKKGGKAKKQAPSKQAKQKAKFKTGQLVGSRADLLNQRTTLKLELPHFTEGDDQPVAAERQKKKKPKKQYLQANHLARL